jgi:hypothetical protein
MTPYTGLTFRLGDREVNVHDVANNTVYFGQYRDDDEWPISLYRLPVPAFESMVSEALEQGAIAYSTVTF